MIWMGYFLTTIGFLGLLTAYMLCTPLYVLSRYYKPAKPYADSLLQKSCALLLSVQPWLKMNVNLPLQLNGKLLVANHRSHLDVFLFLAHVRGVRVLAKDSLFRIPFLGFIMKMSYQIPIVRGNVESYVQSLKTIEEYLKNNEVVLIFPEMTRSSSGLKEFPLAPFKMAREAGAEIVPVVIEGSEKVWPKNSMCLRSGHTVFVSALSPVSSLDFDTSESLSKAVHTRIFEALT